MGVCISVKGRNILSKDNNRLKNTMKKEIDLSYNNSLYKRINMANYEYMRQWICFPANDGDGYDIRNFTKKEKSR